MQRRVYAGSHSTRRARNGVRGTNVCVCVDVESQAPGVLYLQGEHSAEGFRNARTPSL